LQKDLSAHKNKRKIHFRQKYIKIFKKNNFLNLFLSQKAINMVKMVKNKITFTFYLVSLPLEGLGANFNCDCANPGNHSSRRLFQVRGLILSSIFIPFFSILFHRLILCKGDLQNLGLRPLARVSGTGPRQWGDFPKGGRAIGATVLETVAPTARPNFYLNLTIDFEIFLWFVSLPVI
jgi:hypothetical protein